MNADAKAAAVTALDSLTGLQPGDVVADTEHARPGWTVWRAGRMCVTLPTLLPSAPETARQRYWLRVVAGMTGACPACGETATITSMPGSAAFWLLPVEVRLLHADECPARFGEADRPFFDPEAFR